ncbi:PTS sugar transporter subunit IIA [Candidatus Stoquefichus sp. SB1]|jgi:PTS system glucose-specific IIA component|uniref:PTS sugar transporter subunit IIA n=1 Tax=Candidatus Stoquefichus sp. SB1 TaxID=1658109 RepID=UPI00067E7732|nr:PTS glucose transporter subunit IIA [Candidatus Stoquefichus sp. SB1]
MFRFKKNKSCVLYSPVKGKSILLENIPDKVFADKLIGDGIGFSFDDNVIYSPCDGEIIMIANSKHAIGMKTENGVEILLHVGLETVNLDGQGIEVLINIHDKVKAHDPIMKLDRQFMDMHHVDLTTPLIITDLKGYHLVISHPQKVDISDVVIQINSK